MYRILVVDDSALLHSMFELTLAQLPDCHLSFAKNGMEALEKLSSEGEPDLILLDINMPVMDGLEFMTKLRSIGALPRVSVVIVSTEDREADVLRGLEAGAKAYLRKPFTPTDLHRIVTQVLVAPQ